MKLDDSLKSHLRDIFRAVTNRVRWTLKFPVENDDTYALFTDLIPSGIRVRMRDVLDIECYSGPLITRVSSTTVRVNSTHVLVVTFSGDSKPAPMSTVSELTIRRNHPALPAIQHWAEEVTALDAALAVANRVMYRVTRECNTSGQVIRMLPEAATLFGGDHHGRVRSPLPKHLTDHDKEFIEANCESAGDLLLKGGLLPREFNRLPSVWLKRTP